jgi:hypothetical protein
LEEQIVHIQNSFSSNNNNTTTLSSGMRENVQNNPSNVTTDMYQTTNISKNIDDTNTNNRVIDTSTASIIITSNTITDVTTLPSIYTKSSFSASSPRLVNMQIVTNPHEMISSPMDDEVSFLILFLIRA